MTMQPEFNSYLLLGCLLFIIGLAGAMLRRNILVIFMSIELMLNACNLILVYFSTLFEDARAQVFVFFIMAVAAAEVAIGLSIVVMAYRKKLSLDIDSYDSLKH